MTEKMNKLSEIELVKKLKQAREFYNSLLNMGYMGNNRNMQELDTLMKDIKGHLMALRGRV